MVRPRFDRHVFVCVHGRPSGGKPSCGERAGASVHAALLNAVAADAALCGRVAVTESGCLGPCYEGPNVIVYPEGVWYAHVSVGDVAAIVDEHLRHGRPVAALERDGDGQSEPAARHDQADQ